MNRLRWILAAAAIVAMGAACSDDSTGAAPRAGTVVLRLTTPHADDGALIFEVSGPPIDSATASSPSLRLFTHRADGSRLVGVVAGVIDSGSLVTLHVPDVGAAAEYTARLVEVADRQNALRASLPGYAVSVTP